MDSLRIRAQVTKVLYRMASNVEVKNLLRPVIHRVQDFSNGDILARNGLLKDRYQGRRCFILCTGASLNQIDITKLAGEYTFGCNLIIKHADLEKITLAFYASTDTLYGLVNSPEVMEHPRVLFPTLERVLNQQATVLFFQAGCRNFIEKNGYLTGREVYFVKPGRPSEILECQSNDLTGRITFLGGSIYFMIGAAMYMGFKELYLCGCGYTYRPRQSGHFYEDWTVLDGGAVEERHEIVKRYAGARGVEIYNIVPKGFESPVYKKLAWNDVVEGVLKRGVPA